jgi:hypothetical protein
MFPAEYMAQHSPQPLHIALVRIILLIIKFSVNFVLPFLITLSLSILKRINERWYLYVIAVLVSIAVGYFFSKDGNLPGP